MSNNKQFDRAVLCALVFLFAIIAVYGMRAGNGDITRFASAQFALFSGALLALMNKELLSGNGNGNGNGTSQANHTEEKKEVG